MKILFFASTLALCILLNFTQTDENLLNESTVDISLLKGTWKIDLSPEDTTDANFAKMVITEVGKNSLNGYFYRDGVKIREGRINTQRGIIYAALVSGDNSGTYHTSFFYKEGLLYGSTHSIDKDFLAVWIGTKEIE
ncbi:hypothetical protein H2O64_01700 [Kordia sp. YSTF-M3]|uniref:Lipocalin-like domain-containing protein n=1 Tax=Kordia aestuariivivens TaxID=2759037 RepID=A0ABR7Q491_9FLAO|nr:hypothetical protein [Kordia aestuariivivens]MBC8753365.1 hypothetical protein [Kordia aestuariivivens]